MKGLGEGDVAAASVPMRDGGETVVTRATAEHPPPLADPEAEPKAGPRVMRLRYRGVCELCGIGLPAGTSAVYDRERHKVRCFECPTTGEEPDTAAEEPDAFAVPVAGSAEPVPSAPTVVSGTAGGSAQRIYERRAARNRAEREARMAEDQAWRERAKTEHPILGRLASAITPKEMVGPEPQHITAWKAGAEGEQRIGRRLEEWAAAGGGMVLHDRSKPGSKANIDHIAVAPSGIYVIDAKRYDGKVEAVDVGGWFKTDIRLKVAGRDRTKLTNGVADQVETVSSALAAAWPREVRPSVQGVLCFIDSHWGWLAKPFRVNDVIVAWPGATVEILDRPGSWDSAAVSEITSALAAALREA